MSVRIFHLFEYTIFGHVCWGLLRNLKLSHDPLPSYLLNSYILSYFWGFGRLPWLNSACRSLAHLHFLIIVLVLSELFLVNYIGLDWICIDEAAKLIGFAAIRITLWAEIIDLAILVLLVDGCRDTDARNVFVIYFKAVDMAVLDPFADANRADAVVFGIRSRIIWGTTNSVNDINLRILAADLSLWNLLLLDDWNLFSRISNTRLSLDHALSRNLAFTLQLLLLAGFLCSIKSIQLHLAFIPSCRLLMRHQRVRDRTRPLCVNRYLLSFSTGSSQRRWARQLMTHQSWKLGLSHALATTKSSRVIS